MAESLTAAAREVGRLRYEYELKKEAAEQAKLAYDTAHFALYARMEEEEVGAIKVGDTNFVRAQTVYGQVQDLEKFVEWAEENAPELLQQKARAQQVNELVRECVETGTQPPPGLGFYVKQYVGQRAA